MITGLTSLFNCPSLQFFTPTDHNQGEAGLVISNSIKTKNINQNLNSIRVQQDALRLSI